MAPTCQPLTDCASERVVSPACASDASWHPGFVRRRSAHEDVAQADQAVAVLGRVFGVVEGHVGENDLGRHAGRHRIGDCAHSQGSARHHQQVDDREFRVDDGAELERAAGLDGHGIDIRCGNQVVGDSDARPNGNDVPGGWKPVLSPHGGIRPVAEIAGP